MIKILRKKTRDRSLEEKYLEGLIVQSNNKKTRGILLKNIHYKFGTILGSTIARKTKYNEDTCIICMDNSSIFIASGLWEFFSQSPLIIISNPNDILTESDNIFKKNVILVGALINNETKMHEILVLIENRVKSITIATDMINKETVNTLNVDNIYAIRKEHTKKSNENFKDQLFNLREDNVE